MPKLLSKSISKALHRIRFGHPHFRGKARLFGFIRRMMGHSRMVIPYANGGWISVDDRGEYIEKEIWCRGELEVEVWETLSGFALANEILWDIGANIGTVAIRGGLDNRIREVHCFEPHPKMLNLLQLNLTLNTGNYHVHPIALSDKHGQLYFHLGAKNDSSTASLVTGQGINDILVQCKTIDELVFSKQISPASLIKLDVEGWEEQVLVGGQNFIKQYAPKAIVFEAECDSNTVIQNTNLIRFFEDHNYQVDWIRRPSGKMHSNSARTNFVENFVAFHR